MRLNATSKILLILLQCSIVMLGGSGNERFSQLGYAQEHNLRSGAYRDDKGSVISKKRLFHSDRLFVCSVEKKTNCTSRPLLAEHVRSEEVLKKVPTSTLLVKTSLYNRQSQNNFLTPEIYVDRQHRNFQDEILEIFDQSLVVQDWEGGTPILLECHCDDREPLAYSLVLGHRWGKRAKAYLLNLGGQLPQIELMNYGSAFDVCDRNWGECQEGSRLQATFRFLAIREPNSGCLIRLQLPTQLNHRERVVEKYPLFLQEIHVAGVW